MKKYLLLILLILPTLGCHVTGYWTKVDFNQQQWKKDYYRCNYESKILCQHDDWILCWRDNMIDCLSAKGYHYIKD